MNDTLVGTPLVVVGIVLVLVGAFLAFGGFLELIESSSPSDEVVVKEDGTCVVYEDSGSRVEEKNVPCDESGGDGTNLVFGLAIAVVGGYSVRRGSN